MQGSAVGLGMTMSLPAAIRIGCQKSKYGFVFPRRGLTMESSSSFFLPRLIGYSNALYLLTTGGTFSPTSPHFGTLFQETYPDPNQVVARALELAAEIAENVSPMASYLSRELMWRNPGSAEETHLVDSAVLYHMFSGRYDFSNSFHQASFEKFARQKSNTDHIIGTQRKASKHSSRNENQISMQLLRVMHRPAFLGGLMLISGDVRRQARRNCR